MATSATRVRKLPASTAVVQATPRAEECRGVSSVVMVPCGGAGGRGACSVAARPRGHPRDNRHPGVRLSPPTDGGCPMGRCFDGGMAGSAAPDGGGRVQPPPVQPRARRGRSGSKAARFALRHAVAGAVNRRWRLTRVTVVPHPPGFVSAGGVSPDALAEESSAAADKALRGGRCRAAGRSLGHDAGAPRQSGRRDPRAAARGALRSGVDGHPRARSRRQRAARLGLGRGDAPQPRAGHRRAPGARAAGRRDLTERGGEQDDRAEGETPPPPPLPRRAPAGRRGCRSRGPRRGPCRGRSASG